MHNLAEKTYADIAAGELAQFDVELTEALVNEFARMSGDTNPLHMDDAYASETDFGGRIAHGFAGASLFSRLVGMHLPGKYALYLSQNILFKKPMRIGMKLRVEGTVTQKIDLGNAIKVHTRILDAESGDCLVDGEAIVKVLK